jgi:hypothetical protein
MLGPVQVLVVEVAGADGARDLAAAVAALPTDGPVRCLDVFELTVAGDGQLTVTGSDAEPVSLRLFADAVDDVVAVPSAEGTWNLGEVVSPGSLAVVAVLEHQWALGLRDALQSAGGSIRYESWLDADDRATLEGWLGARDGQPGAGGGGGGSGA